MSRKSCSSNSEHSHSADSTSASAVALPYFSIQPLVQRPGVHADADRRRRRPWPPWRSRRPCRRTCLDVARVHPHRRTAGVDRGEDVLRLEVDVGDHRDLRLLRDHRQRVGVVLRRAPPPARSGSPRRSAARSAAASRSRRRSASWSSTARDTGASPPTGTLPTMIWRDLRRSQAAWSGVEGMPSATAVMFSPST